MPIDLLTGATATGAGTGKKVSPLNATHTVQAVFTGAITALTVDLEGSLDGVTWFTLDSHAFAAGEITAKAALVFVTAKPVEMVRENITAITGTGVVDVKYGQGS